MWEESVHLNEIVVNAALFAHTTGSIHLHENPKQAALHDLFIDNVSSEGITLKPDRNKISFFKHNFGNRRCDYIILSETEKKRVALFVEMKSTSLSDIDIEEGFPHDLGHGYPDCVQQLRSTSCFFDFIDLVLQDYCKCNALSNYSKAKHRYFVVFHSKKTLNALSSNQLLLPIRPTRLPCNNTPQTALILYAENNNHLSFEQLILPDD